MYQGKSTQPVCQFVLSFMMPNNNNINSNFCDWNTIQPNNKSNNNSCYSNGNSLVKSSSCLFEIMLSLLELQYNNNNSALTAIIDIVWSFLIEFSSLVSNALSYVLFACSIFHAVLVVFVFDQLYWC